MALRYLLDEHMPPAYQAQLIRLEPTLTVWKVGGVGVPPLSTPDPDILLWCEARDFVLVTNNRKSMPVHLADHLAAGHHVPGILTVDLSRGMAVLLEDLVLIALAAGEDEYRDRIGYVPLP